MVATSHLQLFKLAFTSPRDTFSQLLHARPTSPLPQVQPSCHHLREASPDRHLLKPHISHYNILLLSSRIDFYYLLFVLSVSPLE